MKLAMARESEEGQERTEQPTSKRLRDAREKGQVAKSLELITAILFLTTVLAFYFYIPSVASKLASVTKYYLGNLMAWNGSTESLIGIFHFMVVQTAMMLLPIFLIFLVIGLVSNIVQVGFTISVEPLVPKLSKLNPLTGIKNKFFSVRSLEQLIKSLLILTVIAWVAYRAIKRELPVFPPLINSDVSVIALTFFRATMHLLWDALWVFIIIAIVDFAFQRRQHIQDLMMTKQEVKEEMRQTEGDPQIKSRIRSIQFQMARRRMLKAVPKASVVITNPTHLAIALQYERGRMIAPMVVAKGAGLIAEKIKETARHASVPIVENKPLAQALYKSVEIGEYIPEDLYRATAEILAYVYRLRPGINL
jgi:flagellar biosynthetic protein FlhB